MTFDTALFPLVADLLHTFVRWVEYLYLDTTKFVVEMLLHNFTDYPLDVHFIRAIIIESGRTKKFQQIKIIKPKIVG